MANKVAFFGGTSSGANTQLWKLARYPMPSREAQNPVQVVPGADQPTPVAIGNSENIYDRWEVVTFASPQPLVYTQEAWISQENAILAAYATLRPTPGPLIWISDDSYGGVLTAGGGTAIVLPTGHGLVAGNRVLVRRVGAFVVRTVLSLTGANTVNLTANLAPYNALAGDRAYRISSMIGDVYMAGVKLPKPERGPHGHFFAPEVTWSFEGVPLTRYDRIVASLEA